MKVNENAPGPGAGKKVSKMNIQQHTYRGRAAMVLHRLVGGSARERHFPDLPVAIEIPHAKLIVTAGDNERTLDPAALKAVALRTGWSVLATWVDPMISGHRFVIDAVVITAAETLLAPDRRLLITARGERFLSAEHGEGPVIAIGSGGIARMPRRPAHTEADRLFGITAGQAYLHQQIYAGTPYATPLDRNIGR